MRRSVNAHQIVTRLLISAAILSGSASAFDFEMSTGKKCESITPYRCITNKCAARPEECSQVREELIPQTPRLKPVRWHLHGGLLFWDKDASTSGGILGEGISAAQPFVAAGTHIRYPKYNLQVELRYGNTKVGERKFTNFQVDMQGGAYRYFWLQKFTYRRYEGANDYRFLPAFGYPIDLFEGTMQIIPNVGLALWDSTPENAANDHFEPGIHLGATVSIYLPEISYSLVVSTLLLKNANRSEIERGFLIRNELFVPLSNIGIGRIGPHISIEFEDVAQAFLQIGTFSLKIDI